MKAKNKQVDSVVVADVESRMLMIHGEAVLLAQDVASLYGLETKHVLQAVRNNPDKFPEGFIVDVTDCDDEVLRSKILTLKQAGGSGRHSKHGYKVFTERGLYMLATILKSPTAVRTTLAIINTYAQVRGLKRELVEMHKETNAGKRSAMMRHFGETLTDIVMPDLDTVETESLLELNFFIGKIKHTVRRVKRVDGKM